MNIQVNTAITDDEEIRKLLLACPAGCCKCMDGKLTFSWLGCLECGTCRVLSDGKIVEEGEHNELIAMNGVYKRLYETQFRKVIEMENEKSA